MTVLESVVNRSEARAWATVSLDAIAHNVRTLRALLPSGTAFMAVVKADAYGHGAVPVAQAAVGAGAEWLGVATAEEALDLRAAGIRSPILVLGPVANTWLADLVTAGCSITVQDEASVRALAGIAGPDRPRIHIKVDTGMTRLGVAVDEVADLVAAIDPARVVVEGVFTHLACADDPDPGPTRTQLALFSAAATVVRRRFPQALRHVAASAAVLAYPDAVLDLVRIGIALYGVPPAPHLASVALQPAMTLQARVVRARRVSAGTPVSYGATYRAPRETVIATVPVGYADGYPRTLSGVGWMLVAGRRCRVAGRVCMDYTMLDVGETPVCQGDVVTVFGPGLPVAEVAETAGTIAYEVLCRVGPRVPRIYLADDRPVAVASGGLREAASDAGVRGAAGR
jgi:alanine racemase